MFLYISVACCFRVSVPAQIHWQTNSVHVPGVGRQIHFVLYEKKKSWLKDCVENACLCLQPSVNLSKNVPHPEGQPKGSTLLEPWVQIANVFG